MTIHSGQEQINNLRERIRSSEDIPSRATNIDSDEDDSVVDSLARRDPTEAWLLGG
ncbi:hypothetical protein AArcCO_0743 [Halalkaliarchaeum sp. AArc-CO]|nr:hypothetical protein AArcCO_0743 [Halalkaliarchaeum sp. AArc-CO]